jgi:hypothetical protein
MISLRLKRRPLTSWMLLPCIFCYGLFCVFFFVEWVDPSLQGLSQQHIAADSTTYMYIADVLWGKHFDPLAIAALATFPNTLWMPVAIAVVFRNTLAIAVLDNLMFFASIRLFTKACPALDPYWFVALLLINPTTGISLLSVNKEIIDLLAVALFCYAQSRTRSVLLFLSLALALLNRYEVCCSMLLFLAAQSRVNPLRNRRFVTLLALSFAMTIALPPLAAKNMQTHYAEAENAGLVRALDILEMHYLFTVAVLPKIAENMFGELVNAVHWSKYSFDDLANSYILFLNNLASLVVVLLLILRRGLNIRNEWIYFAAMGAIVMASALVNQPRYFYFVYVLLCLQVAYRESPAPSLSVSPGFQQESVRA